MYKKILTALILILPIVALGIRIFENGYVPKADTTTIQAPSVTPAPQPSAMPSGS